MSDTKTTDNNSDHRIAPAPKPSFTMPNLPSNQPEHDLKEVYQKLSESFNVVSRVIATYPEIEAAKLGAINEQLSELFSSVNDISAAHQRFESSRKILKRDLNGYGCDQTSVNNAGRIFKSFEELAANNAEAE